MEFERGIKSLERNFHLLASCLQTEQSSCPYILPTSCHLKGVGLIYARRKNHYSHFFVAIAQRNLINNQNYTEYFQRTHVSSHNAVDAHIQREADFSLHFSRHKHWITNIGTPAINLYVLIVHGLALCVFVRRFISVWREHVTIMEICSK